MTIKQTLEWFKAAVPNPDQDSVRVQFGCHFEEVAEQMGNICAVQTVAGDQLNLDDLSTLAESLKNGSADIAVLCRVGVLYALCDQIVTAVGIAHMMGMDIEGALAEVNRANFSKFENGKPVFLEGGKIGKGADYLAPDLSRFIGGDV